GGGGGCRLRGAGGGYTGGGVATRRDIHANPEVGFGVQRTAAIVAKELAEIGLEVHTGIGGTGVVGVLRKGSSRQTIGLRADMDALPIHEGSEATDCSQTANRYNARRTDGHTTCR